MATDATYKTAYSGKWIGVFTVTLGNGIISPPGGETKTLTTSFPAAMVGDMYIVIAESKGDSNVVIDGTGVVTTKGTITAGISYLNSVFDYSQRFIVVCL